MSEFKFVWDMRKSKANFAKHGVTFEEAQTAFFDQNGTEFYDTKHSDLGEDRYLFLGLSVRLRLLLVCHCYREDELTIRIISARKATRTESKFYRNWDLS